MADPSSSPRSAAVQMAGTVCAVASLRRRSHMSITIGTDVILRGADHGISHPPARAVAARPTVPSPVAPPRIGDIDVGISDRYAFDQHCDVGRIIGIETRQPGVAQGGHLRRNSVQNQLIVGVIEGQSGRYALRRNNCDHRVRHDECADAGKVDRVIVGCSDDIQLGRAGRFAGMAGGGKRYQCQKAKQQKAVADAPNERG